MKFFFDHDVPNHLQGLIDLIFHIWVDEYHFKVERKDFPDLEKIEEHYERVGGLFLVALQEKEIIGTIATQRLNEKNFVLKRMFVKKEYRGTGVAQQLLNRLQQELLYLNLNRPVSLFLSTKEDQAIAAKKFYLKNGFHVIKKTSLPKNFPFFYQDNLFLKKILNHASSH